MTFEGEDRTMIHSKVRDQFAEPELMSLLWCDFINYYLSFFFLSMVLLWMLFSYRSSYHFFLEE